MTSLRRRLTVGSVLVLGLAANTSPVGASGACDLFVDKVAHPTELVLGQTVEITLTLDGRCPPATTGQDADIILAIDRSASQRDNGTWQPTIQAASVFLDLVDFSRHKIGILTFSGGLPILDPEVVFHQRLTSDGAAARAALAAIPPPPVYTFATNITAAIEAAQEELQSPRHRPAAKPIIVLESDGAHNAPNTRSPVDAAADAKDAGTLIITIGLAVDGGAASTLRAIASRPELYFPAPTADDLEAVLRDVAGQVSPGTITGVTITDMLPPEIEYVPGTASPTPSAFASNTFTWQIAQLPASGFTARYVVRPLVAGTYATNKLATVAFTDADGSAGSRTFPQPLITVRLPAPTPLPERSVILLPLVERKHCRPSKPADVVLAIDTSSSMWGEKLTRARDAAREFAALLAMPPSQMAVVAFNDTATMVQSLTADRSAVLAALDRLPREEGSRLDLALGVASAELAGARRNTANIAAIILVTDGRQTGAPEQAVLDAAASARAAGTIVFTIGIGPDADGSLLALAAGDPGHYYPAPSSHDLLSIYRDIAGELPCLGGSE